MGRVRGGRAQVKRAAGRRSAWLLWGSLFAAGVVGVVVMASPDDEEPVRETVSPVEVIPDDAPDEPPSSPPFESLVVRVLRTYPHSTDAFTQGLVWHDGVLYESTGGYGRSSLREVRLEDGAVLKERRLPRELFGEGLAVVNDRLIQLTWREQVAVVWDRTTFEERKRLRYLGEGWGLCFDGRALVMSDGSSMLEIRDPATMELIREVSVLRNGHPVSRLNELECVGSDVYANVWQRDEILRIDAETGRVTAVIDASGLLSSRDAARADVLNGIAYNSESGTFLLTGKLWPRVFEVELVPR